MTSIQFRVQNNQLEYKSDSSGWQKADGNDDNALSIGELEKIGFSKDQAMAFSSKYGGANKLIGIQAKEDGSFSKGEFITALGNFDGDFVNGSTDKAFYQFDTSKLSTLGTHTENNSGEFNNGVIYQDDSGALQYPVGNGNSFATLVNTVAALYSPALNEGEKKQLETHLKKFCADHNLSSKTKAGVSFLLANKTINISEALSNFSKKPEILNKLAEEKPTEKPDENNGTDPAAEAEKKRKEAEAAAEAEKKQLAAKKAAAAKLAKQKQLGVVLFVLGLLGLTGLFDSNTNRPNRGLPFGQQSMPFNNPFGTMAGGGLGGMTNIFNGG